MSTTITFRRPTAEPLHPETWTRPATGPDADDFRVTQQFDDLDSYWSQADPARAAQKHHATDIGNALCGYPLVAMARSRVTRHQDNATAFGAPNNALCARMDIGPGSGVVIDYWHISRWAVPDGALVEPGAIVAYVGKTGLGQVCHCHITCRINGVLVDPEPLLFGGSLTIGEELMAQPVTGLLHAVLGVDNNIRATPGGAVLRKTTKAIWVDVLAIAEQRVAWTIVGDRTTTGDEWYEIEAYGERGFVAKGLLAPVLTAQGAAVVPQAPQGATEAEVRAAQFQAADAAAKAARVVADSYQPI